MTLDELLLEWSYRSEKGYPRVGSPSDVSILKEILTELNKLDQPQNQSRNQSQNPNQKQIHSQNMMS